MPVRANKPMQPIVELSELIQAMQRIIGRPISPGYAQGHAVVLGTGVTTPTETRIPPDHIAAELSRFRSVLAAAQQELQQLQARVQSELGAEHSDIFSAHLLFLEDPQFIDRVETSIRVDQRSLESAIQVTVDELVKVLDQADNPYLRERAADMRDLQRRLLRHIAQSGSAPLAQLAPESILVARELLPSDLLDFDRHHVVGFVTEIGGETGHAAILARALGVPAVTGITNATRVIAPDTPLLVDGQSGAIVLNPALEQIDSTTARKDSYDRETRDTVDAEQCECITRDGVRVHLYANIGRRFETDQVIRHRLEGVGLFRTEYLFLDQAAAPSFARQRDLYRQVAASLAGLPLVIRTLDLGGDKWPAFLQRQFEVNPNLGVRGLRFSLLASQELLRTQIRAVLHVARDFDVRIMLPMVLGPADLKQAISIIREVADTEGIARLPPIGALVETPAAVFTIDEILAAADFISIGTNDLTQFILAADRNALALIDDYTVLHPAVLRAVHQMLRAAASAGKPVTVCGEAAADPRVACLLAGLGARMLSMSPVSAARVRYALRAARQDAMEHLAQTALGCDSAACVAALITDLLQDSLPEFRHSLIPV